MEGEESEAPSAGVCEPAADPRESGTTVAAMADRVEGATVRTSFRHERVAPNLRPGPRQPPHATADSTVWIQSGIADGPSDASRYALESPAPRPGASLDVIRGGNGPLDGLGSARGALLGVDPPKSLYWATRTHH